eukprot:m.68971 g.68971  ORF g.68971 m.68971 type:complete len:496 (+) comp13708_c4_seq1:216-1703(+)
MGDTKEWARNGSFMKKPASGWLHDDHALMHGDGIFYAVRYVGSIRMDKSMRTMRFDTRTEVTREAIRLVCEAGGLVPPKKRKVSQIVKETLTADPLIRNWDVKFTVSTSGIALVVVQTNDVIANHIMPCISFATGGEAYGYTTIGYVAKDSRNIRECHVFECGEMAPEIMATLGQAFELRYKAFLKKSTERQNMRMAQPVQGMAIYGDESGVAYDRGDARDGQYDDLPEAYGPGSRSHGYDDMDSYGDTGYPQLRRSGPVYDSVSETMYGDRDGHAQYQGVDPDYDQGQYQGIDPDYQPGVNPGYLDVTADPVYDNPNDAQSKGGQRRVRNDPAYDNPQGDQGLQRRVIYDGDYDYATDLPDYDDSFDDIPTSKLMQAPPQQYRDLAGEMWFHGQLSRAVADSILTYDGDFLVRESMQSRGQYILSAMQKGERKHLLLVDPSGQVRTKDMAFDSVPHLINYHIRARLPIISRGSRIILGQPVPAGPDGYAKLGKK